MYIPQITPRERHQSQCAVMDKAHVICGTLSSFGADSVKQILLRSDDLVHKEETFSCVIIDEVRKSHYVDKCCLGTCIELDFYNRSYRKISVSLMGSFGMRLISVLKPAHSASYLCTCATYLLAWAKFFKCLKP